MTADPIFCQFSRSKVQRSDFRDSLGRYAPGRLHTYAACG